MRAMRDYQLGGNYLDLEHAVRTARLAWFHASKLKGYTYWKPEALKVK